MNPFKTGEEPKALNRLARERMKVRLLTDIRTDLTICKIEGWDHAEYLSELKSMIDELLKRQQTKKVEGYKNESF